MTEINEGRFTRRDFLKLASITPFLPVTLKLFPLEAGVGKKDGKKELEFKEPVNTPPSLMLHSANMPLVKELIPAIENAGYNTITYRDYYRKLINRTSVDRPLLISIDDLGTSWLRKDFKVMIGEMEQVGMKGTLGIVTSGTREEAKPEIWQYLRDVLNNGWELAIHTEDHYHLSSLSDKELARQIKEPFEEIAMATRYLPETLILPFGGINKPNTNEMDQRIFSVCRNLGIRWIVGIQGGKSFQGTEPFYVGRIPPGRGGVETVRMLENSFEAANYFRTPKGRQQRS